MSQAETWLPHCNNGHLMWWAITITHTPPIIVACKIWQTMTVLYKLLCGMKVMVYNTWEIREEDVRLWCGWKVHLVGSYNPWRHKEGNNPGTSWSTHFQLPWPYTFPVTMALHISSYHGPTCVETWLLFTMEQSVSNNKEVLPHERRHLLAGEITVTYT